MNKKLTLVERLEKIYEFFNVGYENGFIGNDEPDCSIVENVELWKQLN